MVRALAFFFSLLILVIVAWLYFGYQHSSTPMIPEGHAETDFAEWVLYTSPTASFQVFFPTLPQTASSVVTDPSTQEKKGLMTHISQHRDGTTYLVNVIVIPEESRDKGDEAALNEAIQQIVAANPNNQLKEIKNNTHKNNKAVDFAIENGKNEVIGKAIKQGNYIYVLTVMHPEGTIDPKEFNFFINSFEMQ